MFKKNKKEVMVPSSKGIQTDTKHSTIAAGNTVIGDILSDGDIRIDGTIIGQVVCKAKLILGKTGIVQGNIDVTNATLSGKVKGAVYVRSLLQLQETGKIEGDVCTVKMEMKSGSEIKGSISTENHAKEILKSKQVPDLLAEIREKTIKENKIVETQSSPPIGHTTTNTDPVVQNKPNVNTNQKHHTNQNQQRLGQQKPNEQKFPNR